ncbi:UDP-N-acetylmuramate dehydrogenase [Shewanella electrodiphila]|uniref:UDP-N-acetylenolpyruvoylglucosamine reductase n=1 Tax=Shewanella electrodiphila TaxID=934143 RepID=A0ABT0KWT3_9GAMM|nr:UDP-N-acetylmuramate dehydrogenase [Shewanella electrodiphila]MCL1047855.1 UDP-N-acetylmuramate dehydrogenase [Shewanella electrodiphila]
MNYHFQKNLNMPVSLKPFNTLALEQGCLQFVEVTSVIELKQQLIKAANASLPTLILGGGSNVVFTSDYQGVVIKVATKGIEVSEDAEAFYISVQAGESWHEFVGYCLDNGFHGLENLALIPGTVGAAPIQNIGAYGVEINKYCQKVSYLDLASLESNTLTNSECHFGYRDSIFKNELKNQIAITEVQFRLPKVWQANIEYGPLQHFNLETVTPKQVYDTVCDIRKSKLPDPAVLGNVGSFFKNPIIEASQYIELLKTYSDLVGYAQVDGKIKIAAGWLIDEAGLKGVNKGRAAVHDKQALVLVNLDDAVGEDICQLAHYIMDIVLAKFGIQLDPEPRIIGATGEENL